MTPEEYCQQQAAPAGSSAYYSFMSLPLKQRRISLTPLRKLWIAWRANRRERRRYRQRSQ
jgi:hypothetical protein